MRKILKALTFTGCSALAMVASTAEAGVILFQDSFDSDSATSVLNFTGFNNWAVSNGTVDFIRSSNNYGITCTTGCVDLDGSTRNSGRITTNSAFNLLVEHTYKLSFDLSGNQRLPSVESVSVGFGGFLATLSVNPGNTFNTYSIFLSNLAFSGALFFETTSNDNVGAILDNVAFECTTCDIASVPEPGILGLFAFALAGLGFARKRKSSQIL